MKQQRIIISTTVAILVLAGIIYGYTHSDMYAQWSQAQQAEPQQQAVEPQPAPPQVTEPEIAKPDLCEPGDLGCNARTGEWNYAYPAHCYEDMPSATHRSLEADQEWMDYTLPEWLNNHPECCTNGNPARCPRIGPNPGDAR
jgi:hypothetical protein